jgi:hypothetical protein
VNVTAAQVISAALQNIVIAGCITLAWMYGKVGGEVALPALLLVCGIDFVGRKKLPGASAGAALAFGASGLLSSFPGVGAVLMAVLAFLGTGCGSAVHALPEAAKPIQEASARYAQALATYEANCEPEPVVPEIQPACDAIHAVLEQTAEGINYVVEGYNVVNDKVKELEN